MNGCCAQLHPLGPALPEACRLQPTALPPFMFSLVLLVPAGRLEQGRSRRCPRASLGWWPFFLGRISALVGWSLHLRVGGSQTKAILSPGCAWAFKAQAGSACCRHGAGAEGLSRLPPACTFAISKSVPGSSQTWNGSHREQVASGRPRSGTQAKAELGPGRAAGFPLNPSSSPF